MAGEDWQRLADYVVARRVELGMRDRRAFAEATGVTAVSYTHLTLPTTERV